MLKVFAYLTKREDLETQEFIDYYENHHVPLVFSLALAPPLVYKRNYLVRGDEFNREDDTIDFDVITELVFLTEAGSSSGSTTCRSTPSEPTKRSSSIDRVRGRTSSRSGKPPHKKRLLLVPLWDEKRRFAWRSRTAAAPPERVSDSLTNEGGAVMPKGHYLTEATKDGIWELRAEGLSDREIGVGSAFPGGP